MAGAGSMPAAFTNQSPVSSTHSSRADPPWSPDLFWPSNHELIEVSVEGITDPEGDQISISITSITQDEDVVGGGSGNSCPDAILQGTLTQLRAERAGRLNGRVYRIAFTAMDPAGEACFGLVKVCMPHDEAPTTTCTEDPDVFNSLECP
jgi:hypothetical protein